MTLGQAQDGELEELVRAVEATL
ncbi:MAG: hypothetical protein H6R45_670, partial [Proteobacteria bacterium]|nr:hypothetical protein [Pseudomonadota bacterium]